MNDRIDGRYTPELEELSEVPSQFTQIDDAELRRAIPIDRDQARVRKVVTRGHFGIQGKTPSIKNRRMIHWQGGIEDAVVKLLEFSTGVRTYQEQPVQVKYLLAGESRKYTPDFRVNRPLFHPRPLYLEAKPANIAVKPENQERFEALRSRFAIEGADFRVITDEQINMKTLIWNLDLLLRYRRPYLKDGPWVAEFEKVMKAMPLTFSQALQLVDRVVLLTGLAFQYAEFDYRAGRLGPQTTIQVTDGRTNDFLF